MGFPGTEEIVKKAWESGLIVPGFNIPYPPMMEPVVRALKDCCSFGLVMVANLELKKFEAKSLKTIRDEYEKVKDVKHTRLHLDHVPVIDEDELRVDYEAVIGEALELGFQSAMVDGSRLPLEENIACTAKAAKIAYSYGVPLEAELGAVMGHESGPLPPYEELFKSKKGFTSVEEAARFVKESGCDWLSVAIGNIHGAISAAGRQKEKPRARIDIERLAELKRAAGIPLVLHGGTGIGAEYIREAVKNGIAKMNVAAAIRQAYERALPQGVKTAQDAVYAEMLKLIREELRIEGSARKLGLLD
jgi:ketose-bisphosphate aldolase